MKKEKWITVTNKYTYFLLLTIPVAIIKIIFYDLKQINISDIGFQIFLSIIIAILGIYFFVRLNSYSLWMNPNHPKPNNDDR